MPQLLLTNPRKRGSRRRRVVAKNPKRRTRRNPSLFASHKRRVHHRRRVRRNPSTLGGMGGTIKTAATQGLGAFAVDALAGQLKGYLPTSLQTGLTYSALKFAATLGALHAFGGKHKVVGVALEGSLAVQIYLMALAQLGGSITLGAYAGPGRGRVPALGPGAASSIPNLRVTAMPMRRGVGGMKGYLPTAQTSPNRTTVYR